MHQFLAVEGDGGEAVHRHRRRRFGRDRLKNRNRMRVYRTHPTSRLKVLCGLRLARFLSVGFGELYRLRLIANERSIIDELRILPKSSYYINIIFIIFIIYIQCPITKRVITIKKIIWVIIFIYTHQVQISVFF